MKNNAINQSRITIPIKSICFLLWAIILLQTMGYGLVFALIQPILQQTAALIVQQHELYTHKIEEIEITNNPFALATLHYKRLNTHEFEINNERYDIVKTDSSQQGCVHIWAFPDKAETLLFKLLKKYREENLPNNTPKNTPSNSSNAIPYPFWVWLNQAPPSFQWLDFNNLAAITSVVKTLLPPYCTFWQSFSADVPSPPPRT